MRFLIIGGTEKAGTTAMFNYFYNHPSCIPSIRKETDFFRSKEDLKLEAYLQEFSYGREGVFIEASPGYLAAADRVVSNINKVIGGDGVRVVFILRDPADRIRSSFVFHKSRGYISDEVSFVDYIDAALEYERSGSIAKGISEWALSSVSHGEYFRYVKKYIDDLDGEVTIFDYDFFRESPDKVIKEICCLTGINFRYFEGFDFFSANETFKPKYHSIHRLLIVLNKVFEPFFFRYPNIKASLLKAYKKLNKGVNDGFSDDDIEMIINLYRPSAG